MTVDDTRVAIAVSHGLAELVETGDTDRARTILVRLAAATDDQRTAVAAQLVFLLLAVLMLVDRERPTAREGTTVWPHLLNLATVGPAERDPVLRLWRRALEGPPLQDEAAAVLGTWAAAAEADPELCEAFVRLALAIAKDHDRSRRILLRLAAAWTADDNLAPLPKTGDALRRVLSRPTERA